MKNFKKFDDLVFNITKKIFKRHDNNFLLIISNWNSIIGEKLSSKSYPKKINRYKVLLVSVESEAFLEFQYNTELFLKKINTLLGNKTICKIRLLIKN
tara:strand:- start:7 stop:300 length:294 start_codon:yes stop_codon:yes gene_type:complete